MNLGDIISKFAKKQKEKPESMIDKKNREVKEGRNRRRKRKYKKIRELLKSKFKD